MITEFRRERGVAYVTLMMVLQQHGLEGSRQFARWMEGQTMAQTSSGEAMIYANDYQRWARGLDPDD